MDLVKRTLQFSHDVASINFSFDGYIYNPLDYAWSCHKAFLERYVKQGSKSIFLGINPGPFGMMQTGVPFGEINAVKNYLNIFEPVLSPKVEHPNRKVLGFDVKRSEISGMRLWSLIASHYPNADFQSDIACFNYCPLGFLDGGKTAKNITPDKLQEEERKILEKVCNEYLYDVINYIKPVYLVGVGKYAQKKLENVNTDKNILVCSIIHPSPGNPMANNGWADKTQTKLKEIGLWS